MITNLPHSEVPDYLSVSDFAFATINPSPCRLFCSAIKIGGYWASGLLELVTPGVGDDLAITEAEGGVVFDLGQHGGNAAQRGGEHCRRAGLTRLWRPHSRSRAAPGYGPGARAAYAALLPTV